MDFFLDGLSEVIRIEDIQIDQLKISQLYAKLGHVPALTACEYSYKTSVHSPYWDEPLSHKHQIYTIFYSHDAFSDGALLPCAL